MPKPFAFVLMPFSKEFSDIYKLGIQETATECGVVAERVDEQRYSETMLERIYRQIKDADFIIADMTDRNPNVFYEVGYAHALGKLVTLLTQDANDIPFDLKHHRHIVYGKSIQSLKESLTHEFEWLRKEAESRKFKSFSITLARMTGNLIKGSYRADAEVDLTFELKNETKRKSPEIEAIYLKTGPNWTYELEGVECAAVQTGEGSSVRHFIKSPVARIAPGMWAQVRVRGKKEVWSKFTGEELQDSYRMSGWVKVEVVTSEGTFEQSLDVDLEVDDIPF
ncbi:hypothetical protein GRI69_01185 [Erythrobacter vulgaris]|uniref:Uncharacterized protein n=1 Tax=Qipengyuania vulgaris TaxID=291985 RepID=A0A844XN55_9SPHN|nr:hypothetical protein [Qipengyuania vulgaris]MXO46874.1 hypothetical protein [Qipengyuania vulgaris]